MLKILACFREVGVLCGSIKYMFGSGSSKLGNIRWENFWSQATDGIQGWFFFKKAHACFVEYSENIEESAKF